MGVAVATWGFLRKSLEIDDTALSSSSLTGRGNRLGTSVQEIDLVCKMKKEGFLAKAREMQVQSMQSFLRVCADHALIFTKKRFYLCGVCFLRSSNKFVSACMRCKNVFCGG